MTLETKDLVLRTVNNDDITEVARMWDFQYGDTGVITACDSEQETYNEEIPLPDELYADL